MPSKTLYAFRVYETPDCKFDFSNCSIYFVKPATCESFGVLHACRLDLACTPVAACMLFKRKRHISSCAGTPGPASASNPHCCTLVSCRLTYSANLTFASIFCSQSFVDFSSKQILCQHKSEFESLSLHFRFDSAKRPTVWPHSNSNAWPSSASNPPRSFQCLTILLLRPPAL